MQSRDKEAILINSVLVFLHFFRLLFILPLIIIVVSIFFYYRAVVVIVDEFTLLRFGL